MKKIIVLLIVLISCVSYSQTKKKKVYKKPLLEKKKVKAKKKEDPVILDFSTTKIEDSRSYDEVPVQAVDYTNNDENTVYNSAGIEIAPTFPGGNEKLGMFLSKNIVLSEEMKTAELKGRVYASFTVERDGSITDVKIIREIGYETGTEVLRVLKVMPKWLPAEQNGRKVRCSYTLPIIIDATKQ